MNDSILSKKNSLTLRALGILSILMRNWYHTVFNNGLNSNMQP